MHPLLIVVVIGGACALGAKKGAAAAPSADALPSGGPPCPATTAHTGYLPAANRAHAILASYGPRLTAPDQVKLARALTTETCPKLVMAMANQFTNVPGIYEALYTRAMELRQGLI